MKDITKSITAVVNLGTALENNRVSRELVKDLAAGIESDFSKTIEFKEYQFSQDLSSVGLENAMVPYCMAFNLLKDHAKLSIKEKTEIAKARMKELLEIISYATKTYEVNSKLLDNLLHYYNIEAKATWRIYEEGQDDKKIEMFKSEQKEEDASIDLRYDASTLIDLIKDCDDINQEKKNNLLNILEEISNKNNKRNCHYPFLCFIQNLTDFSSMDNDSMFSILTKTTTKVSAVKLVNTIINGTFSKLLTEFADYSLNYYTRKYFDISDLENINSTISLASRINELGWFEKDNELISLFTNVENSGLDIFIFFIKLIYSKDVKRNNED